MAEKDERMEAVFVVVSRGRRSCSMLVIQNFSKTVRHYFVEIRAQQHLQHVHCYVSCRNISSLTFLRPTTHRCQQKSIPWIHGCIGYNYCRCIVPLKMNMEPKNKPSEREKHLLKILNLHFWGSMWIFQGAFVGFLPTEKTTQQRFNGGSSRDFLEKLRANPPTRSGPSERQGRNPQPQIKCQIATWPPLSKESHFPRHILLGYLCFEVEDKNVE